jgi:hypothetical protein
MEFGCPDRLSPEDRKSGKGNFLCCLNFGCTDVIPVLDYLMQAADLWPDLLITVNFTTLGINATSVSKLASSSVLIVVGMHDDTADILRNTLAIPLVPDAHLLGGVLTNIRYQYESPKIASLGTFSSVRPSVHDFSPTSSLWHTRQRST